MKFILSTHFSKTLPEGGRVYELGPLKLYLEKENLPSTINGCYLLNDGYIRNQDASISDFEGQQNGIIKALKDQWPLPENISGSFSGILIDTKSREVTLCTDHINLYPLYYITTQKEFLVTNSIILAGISSNSEFDKAGIIQRTLGPDYSNIGSRTILRECKRLLPGERRRYSFQGKLLSTDFDNTLYKGISEFPNEQPSPRKYWNTFKKEVTHCLYSSKEVNIALSGGIDSRITLGAIPSDKNLTCYTFGNPRNYETKIASKLAKKKKAKFVTCYKPEVYFPSPDLLRKYTYNTEGVELCSWLELTETVQKQNKEPLLLGELCEALPARKITKFSTKQFRQQNFIKHYVLNKDYSFTPASKEAFVNWKEEIYRKYAIYYNQKNLKKYDFTCDQSELKNALRHDLDQIFDRIEAHDLPYAELFDELFSWYTYTRMRLSKQLLTANSKFHAYSPAMSLNVLRKTSSIHPNFRLNYRFVRRMFTENKELRGLYRVPTNQAPLIPQNFPNIFKFGMWGLRSKMDQYFIGRLMKTRDINRRYRWFHSMNWAKVYQIPEMEDNLKKYFENNHIGEGYFRNIFNQAVQRKKMIQWPFANWNIINTASLNCEIDIIRKGRNNNSYLEKTR